MNNLLSYYGLTDSRMSASDTDLPVQMLNSTIAERGLLGDSLAPNGLGR